MILPREAKGGFSMVEILVILVILGILISFAIPTFVNIKEKIQDREAHTNLKVLQAAEKNYRIETQKYLDCNDTVDCNDQLGADLSGSGFWNYSVSNSSGGDSFCAAAIDMTNGSTRAWHIDQDDQEAIVGGCF